MVLAKWMAHGEVENNATSSLADKRKKEIGQS